MKVGIVTFHRAINYGAVLQTYALQQFLEENAIHAEVIDYRSRTIEELYDVFHPFLNNIRTLSVIPRIKKKNGFQAFIKKFLSLSKEVHTKEELKELINDYDCFITGSDQVWCEKCAKHDQNYFLDFIKDGNMKFSYAASIGKTQFDEKTIECYKELLTQYDYISIREESSRKLLEQCGKRENVFVHVDPTLLLSADKWDRLRKRKVQKGKYILVYTVLGQYHLFEYAKKLSEKTGLPIIYLNDTMLHRQKGMKYQVAVTPEEFVGHFAEAEYVVTNSFHGTVFSILYHKQFMVEVEAVGRRNIRSEELLNSLGLNSRILGSENQDQIESKVEWKIVEQKLEEEREKSRRYFDLIEHVGENG